MFASCQVSTTTDQSATNFQVEDPSGNPGSGNNALPGSSVVAPEDSPPIVELRNLVEPNLEGDSTYSSGTGISGAGSYVRKLTLPKNFAGRLYIGGINISTLAGRFVKVRFSFGVNREVITIPATVSKAPGIIPQTSIDVLVLDLKNAPFSKVRLLYDLYDYKDYDFSTESPISNNRDSNLYCRGLRLEDDSTFVGKGICDGKDGAANLDETCLYTYAKTVDRGLTKKNGATLTNTYPSEPQVDTSNSGYYKDTPSMMLNRCLPDNVPTNFKFSEANASNGMVANTFTAFGAIKNILGQDYVYEGPYLPINEAEWYISDRAVWSTKGLFDQDPDSPPAYPYKSLMFPLYGKMDLLAGNEHLSSSTPDGVKSVLPFPANGQSQWMDGCNIRASSVNTIGEHVGSCNVSAKIELIAKDDNGVEYVINSSNQIVLQLARASQINSSSNSEVLYSNFKKCANSNQCGSSECCFNQRCWSRSLVSQCVEESNVIGNKGIGVTCNSDLECSSFCCNRSSGLCSVHNNNINPPVYCSKPYGEYCLAKEWCQKSVITKCYVVKTGTNPTTGQVTCAQRCYQNYEFGDCANGVCIPPVQPPITSFDPNAADACASAIDPPNF